MRINKQDFAYKIDARTTTTKNRLKLTSFSSEDFPVGKEFVGEFRGDESVHDLLGLGTRSRHLVLEPHPLVLDGKVGISHGTAQAPGLLAAQEEVLKFKHIFQTFTDIFSRIRNGRSEMKCRRHIFLSPT